MIKVPVRFGFVPQEVFEARLAICEKCSDIDGTVCKHCGCHMDSKCQLSLSECPIGKWAKEEE